MICYNAILHNFNLLHKSKNKQRKAKTTNKKRQITAINSECSNQRKTSIAQTGEGAVTIW